MLELCKFRLCLNSQVGFPLFEFMHVIQSNEGLDKSLVIMMEKTKLDVKKTQKGIGQILNLIEKHSEMIKGNEQA